MKKIAVVGWPDQYEELKKLGLPEKVQVDFYDQAQMDFHDMREEMLSDESFSEEDLDDIGLDDPLVDVEWGNYDLVIDLELDRHPENLFHYSDYEGLVVLGCAVRKSLAQIASETPAEVECTLFGLNALPTLLGRPIAEVSLLWEADKLKLEKLMYELEWKYELVQDRVGMASARVVCMIINEACFLVGEGTSDIRGVDQAMKLGTNYPMGPFEWADAIKPVTVLEVLEAMQEDTGEEKYKIAPMLKRQVLLGKNFLN
jgi:3-hydroxybutyryl-CoA dehydrogenase